MLSQIAAIEPSTPTPVVIPADILDVWVTDRIDLHDLARRQKEQFRDAFVEASQETDECLYIVQGSFIFTMAEPSRNAGRYLRLLLPQQFRQQVIDRCHTEVGHAAFLKTLARVQEHYVWPADVSTWFGVTFKQDSEWRDRFHDYVRNRTVFPFWTGKILAGKLWQDLLQESRALLGPISYRDASMNKGIDPGQISNAARYTTEKMIRYLDMLAILEKLEKCRYLMTCDDVVRYCEDLLYISPKRRISFGGTTDHDVILYMYACQGYIVMITARKMIGTKNEFHALVTEAAQRFPGDEKLINFFASLGMLDVLDVLWGLGPRHAQTPIRDIADSEVQGSDVKHVLQDCPSPIEERGLDQKLNGINANIASI
ncbi:hypothetical protein CAPTEDRAFT_226049, partial [Capitella teleta]